MYRVLLFFLLLNISLPLSALELFGLQLESASRDELRAAVQQSGATLISEGNDQRWFDVYDSSTILPGSRRLFLGFVRSNGAFSFAEYEFAGLNARRLLAMLESRHGAADEVRKGDFISDEHYLWTRDGISIELYSDWSNYRVLLSYRENANLQQLQAERRQAMGTDNGVFVY